MFGYGDYSADVDFTQTNNFTIIFLNVISSYIYDGTSSYSVTFTDNVDDTLAVAQMVSGQAFSTLYGEANYADRLKIFALKGEIEVIAPSAIISGVAHIGAIPTGAVSGGVKVSNLINRAAKTIELKKNPRIALRASINNTAVLHQDIQNLS